MKLFSSLLLLIEFILSWSIVITFLSVLIPSLLKPIISLTRGDWLILLIIEIICFGIILSKFEADKLKLI